MSGKAKAFILGVALTFAAAFIVSAETTGQLKARAKPSEFGTITLMTSQPAKASPVVFKHWLHRSKYTCRLCHIDIGFGMKAGITQISCQDNRANLYCGTCHNGTESFAIDGTTAELGGVKNCDRCHSFGKNIPMKYDFYAFSKPLRKERFGNGIDWLYAEEKGMIQLRDYLEGVSIRRERLKDPKDLTLMSREYGMPNIIFSHKKHAVWSGCELCHPAMFGVKSGKDQYSMQEIFDAKFCGVCHGSVAFPNIDCQRCHTTEVK